MVLPLATAELPAARPRRLDLLSRLHLFAPLSHRVREGTPAAQGRVRALRFPQSAGKARRFGEPAAIRYEQQHRREPEAQRYQEEPP